MTLLQLQSSFAVLPRALEAKVWLDPQKYEYNVKFILPILRDALKDKGRVRVVYSVNKWAVVERGVNEDKDWEEITRLCGDMVVWRQGETNMVLDLSP
jgi:hypothetical protein